MVTLASAAAKAELLARRTHTHARLFRIARIDGVVIRLTEHSAPLTFDGEVYLPTQSANASAAVSRGGLGENSLDASGAITSDLITEEDLRAGRYRDAEILEILVDYQFPFLGAIEVARLWIRGTKQDGDLWQASCGGIASRLEVKVGRLLEKTCWKDFGDLKTCKKDTAPLSDFYAPISDVLDSRTFRVASLGSTRPFGHFSYGRAIWRTGQNNALSGLVQAYDNANQLLTLAVQMPLNISVGDRVDLIVGCSRTAQRCKQLDNFANFGGLPFLPTTDEQIKPATS